MVLCSAPGSSGPEQRGRVQEKAQREDGIFQQARVQQAKPRQMLREEIASSVHLVWELDLRNDNNTCREPGVAG